MAASARGPPSGAPLWRGSVFMSVFKSTAPWRQKERKREIELPLFPMCPQSVFRSWGDSVSTLSCFSFPCLHIYFLPSRLSDLENVDHTVPSKESM